MSQVERRSNGRQPVPDLEDLPSLKAYQTLRDMLYGFEGVLVENFFALPANEREAFVCEVIDVLYEFRQTRESLMNCGNLCPKGRTCVPCAS